MTSSPRDTTPSQGAKENITTREKVRDHEPGYPYVSCKTRLAFKAPPCPDCGDDWGAEARREKKALAVLSVLEATGKDRLVTLAEDTESTCDFKENGKPCPSCAGVLLTAARALQIAQNTEAGTEYGDCEAALQEIGVALGMTDEQLFAATGPWVMCDDKCQECAGLARSANPAEARTCFSCGGTGLLTIKPEPGQQPKLSDLTALQHDLAAAREFRARVDALTRAACTGYRDGTGCGGVIPDEEIVALHTGLAAALAGTEQERG